MLEPHERYRRDYEREQENKKRERLRLQLARDLVHGRISGSYYLAETAKLRELPQPADNTEDAEDTRAAEFQDELERRFP